MTIPRTSPGEIPPAKKAREISRTAAYQERGSCSRRPPSEKVSISTLFSQAQALSSERRTPFTAVVPMSKVAIYRIEFLPLLPPP